MATNDSTTGGFLVPVGDEPLQDNALDDALHDTIAGLLGLDAEMVRPRWQPNPPNQPGFTQSWVSFGVTSSEPDVFAYEGQPDNEHEVVERDELLYVLLSFYGPQAAVLDARVRAGLQIVQNRHLLADINVGVVEHQKPTRVPALIKETWVPRIDSTLLLRRRSVHTYQVRTVENPTGMLDNERYQTPLVYAPDDTLPT